MKLKTFLLSAVVFVSLMFSAASFALSTYETDFTEYYQPATYSVWRLVPDRDIFVIQRFSDGYTRVTSDKTTIVLKPNATWTYYVTGSTDWGYLPYETNDNINFIIWYAATNNIPNVIGWCMNSSYAPPCFYPYIQTGYGGKKK